MNFIIEEDLNNIIAENLSWSKLKNKKILITGANGFLGSYFVYVLISLNKKYNLNITIYALCRNSKKAMEKFGDYNNQHGLNIIYQDVCQEISDEYKSDMIIHAASPANRRLYFEEPYQVVKANVCACNLLLEKCEKWNVEQMLVFSSSAVYGKEMPSELVKEEYRGQIDFTDSNEVYALSKQLMENLIETKRKKTGLVINVVRPFLVYGPGDGYSSGKAITDFLKNYIFSENIIIKSREELYRSYVYISEAIKAVFYVLLFGKGDTYNISSEKNIYSIKELATIISELHGTICVEFFENKEIKGEEKKTIIGSSEKIERLGWNNKIDIKEGLIRTIKWAENSNFINL